MSLMGFPKKKNWIGGWVGGLSSIQFFLFFWIFFNFAKPLSAVVGVRFRALNATHSATGAVGVGRLQGPWKMGPR